MSMKHLISAAIADGGSLVDLQTRQLMEECFHADLSDVRVHFSSLSRASNQALGSLAFTVDNHICFGQERDSLSCDSFTYLLAHELAHVLQKRSAQQSRSAFPAVSKRQLEQEANSIASGVLKRMPVTHVTPDPSFQPRFYGPAGHYYTALYTSLAAGFPFETAKSVAFFTQLPDLVSELDAVVAGKDWVSQFANSTNDRLNAYDAALNLNFSGMRQYFSAEDRSIDRMVADWQIQAGLHSLTGNGAEAETAVRTKLLMACKSPEDIPNFGLAVHAYGDSFAHRDFHDGNFMYGPPFGHAAELVNHTIRMDSSHDPHDPDRIELRPWLYLRYCEGLYTIFSTMAKGKAPVALETFKNNVYDVTREKSEETQEAVLKRNIRDICGKITDQESAAKAMDNLYDPPDEAIPWTNFRALQPWLDPGLLFKCIQCSALWTGSAEPFKFSVHGSWSDLAHNVLPSQDGIEDAIMTITGGNLTPQQFMSGF